MNRRDVAVEYSVVLACTVKYNQQEEEQKENEREKEKEKKLMMLIIMGKLLRYSVDRVRRLLRPSNSAYIMYLSRAQEAVKMLAA